MLPKASPAPGKERQSRKWTAEEDAILRKLWHSTCGVEIAQKLNREYKSLMAHAKKIGLKKNKSHKPSLSSKVSQPSPHEPKNIKKMVSVRIDKRTIVQVPEGSDTQKIKNKYGKN
jgi:hypothetical protein